MYIATNRFRIALGREEEFEQIWRERDTYLDEVPGFKEFHLLRGATTEKHTLFVSHSQWDNHTAFEAWTKYEAFKKAHGGSGAKKGIYLGHPQFEGFEVIL